MQRAQFDRDDAERLLTALAGVVSAHIVTDTAGTVVEIHVLATPELHPKQVVRNVESALSAGMGIHVDRRIVSVAQIRAESNGAASPAAATKRPVLPDLREEDDAVDAPEPEPSSRLEYVRYQARRVEDRCSCEVILRDPDREVAGTGSGLDTPEGRATAAAVAVLDAIERFRPGLHLDLEGVVIATARGRQYVLVSARALLDRSTIHLAGAASLHHSPEEAAILAALQASNRWSG